MTKKLIVAMALAGLVLAGAGCKKKKTESDPAQGSGTADPTMGSSGSAMASGSAMGSAGSATAPTADTADKLEILADHNDPTKGPVTVTFTGVKVVKATFDPANLEGGTAEIEVDVGSLGTGVAKRDGHLKTPDYLDQAKFPAVSIKVDNVKKSGDKAYTADATINAHGIEKKVPVTFTVADQTADSVRINGEAKFSRLDFGVGKPEKDDSAKAEMTAKLQVTLHKS